MDRPTDIIDRDLPWDVRRPKEGEANLRSLLAEVKTASAEPTSRSIEILTQIARAEALQGKLREADRTLLEAEKPLASIPGLPPKLRILLERGRLLAAAKTPMQARLRFLEVWELAKAPADAYYAIDAANMLATIETPKKRHEWTMKALEIAEGSSDARARSWRGVLYVSVGWHFLELVQFQKSLEAFESAIRCFSEEKATLNATLARSYMGRTLRMMERYEDALAIQKEILVELERLGATDDLIYEEIAECLHSLKRAAEAQTYFAKAYDELIKRPGLNTPDPARMKRLKTMGKVKDRDQDRDN